MVSLSSVGCVCVYVCVFYVALTTLIHCIDQASLKLTEHCLPPPFIAGMHAIPGPLKNRLAQHEWKPSKNNSREEGDAVGG